MSSIFIVYGGNGTGREGTGGVDGKCRFVLERRDRRHGSEPKEAARLEKKAQRKQLLTIFYHLYTKKAGFAFCLSLVYFFLCIMVRQMNSVQ